MKNLSTKILIIILLVVAVLSGYNYFQRPFLKRFERQTEIVTDDEPNDPLQLTIADLSTKEKIQQLISAPVILGDDEASISAQLAWIAEHKPGFVTIFGSKLTAEQVRDFTVQLRTLSADYQPLVAVDHEGGTVQRLSGEGFTQLPSWRETCQLATEERQELFIQSAKELNQAGINIVFAPVVDVVRLGSFLGSRACLDQEVVISTAGDYIASFARYGILPVAKHFPGIGSLTSDPHFELDAVDLEPQDTLVFDEILTTFPNIGVMTTHAIVPGRTSGIPCSLSAVCLDRFPVNFPEVILFTDALEMRSAGLTENDEEVKELSAVALQAAAAGNQVLVFGETVTAKQLEQVIEVLAEEYLADENFRRQIDISLERVLELKLPQEGGNE
jgi:beta-N-acetylhexosaminidase